MGRHFSASVAADRDQRDAFAGRAVAGAVDMANDVIVDHPHELIDKKRLPLRAFGAVRGLFTQAAGQFLASGHESIAQQFDNGGPRLVALRCDAISNRIGKRTAIDDGALVRNTGGKHRPGL
jgi:hypothetical protein